MIIREIITDQSVLDRFDWFNDYRDTKNWLTGGSLAGPPTLDSIKRDKLVKLLDEGYRRYQKGETA